MIKDFGLLLFIADFLSQFARFQENLVGFQIQNTGRDKSVEAVPGRKEGPGMSERFILNGTADRNQIAQTLLFFRRHLGLDNLWFIRSLPAPEKIFDAHGLLLQPDCYCINTKKSRI